MSASKSKGPPLLPPLTFEPPRTHKTTMIILHGRGSSAKKFADPFLANPVASLSATASEALGPEMEDAKTFRDHFPHTKFIFPTAALRRAVAYNRSLIHQWFDTYSVAKPELKQHLQIAGLQETSAFLHGLLQQEIEIVGASNVALVGLSQGCAASIVATLLWEGEPFGALVGMCGYLPFHKAMQDIINDDEKNESSPFGGDENVTGGLFEWDEEEPDSRSRLEQAVEYLREELGVPKKEDGQTKSLRIQSIPVFMGHGIEDEKVPCENGRSAASLLQAIEMDVEWKEYEGLGHWYSDKMLRDIVRFLKKQKGWDETAEVRDDSRDGHAHEQTRAVYTGLPAQFEEHWEKSGTHNLEQ